MERRLRTFPSRIKQLGGEGNLFLIRRHRQNSSDHGRGILLVEPVLNNDVRPTTTKQRYSSRLEEKNM